ncbi:MAG TPA: hypothetical protein DEZ08_07335 [Dehalococcoidia bacterium]|jgi:DNA replication protein|nr:hypothetical protein [Dehalococcoidia bacterium]
MLLDLIRYLESERFRMSENNFKNMSTSSFFEMMIEQVDDSKELKVILTMYYLLQKVNGYPKIINQSDILSNSLLNRGLYENKQQIRSGLNAVINRGIFTQLSRLDEENSQIYYSLNNEKDLDELLLNGYNVINSDHSPVVPQTQSKKPNIVNPNIFQLYENNIGTITPSISEELKESEQMYPPDWIQEAFDIAVSASKNNWKYIHTILKRWKHEGKKDGKFRRHIKASGSNKHLDEYRKHRLRNN